jgi:hypothetical protein
VAALADSPGRALSRVEEDHDAAAGYASAYHGGPGGRHGLVHQEEVVGACLSLAPSCGGLQLLAHAGAYLLLSDATCRVPFSPPPASPFALAISHVPPRDVGHAPRAQPRAWPSVHLAFRGQTPLLRRSPSGCLVQVPSCLAQPFWQRLCHACRMV